MMKGLNTPSLINKNSEMSYNTNSIPTIKTIKALRGDSVTIDLGKTFSGTMSAWMKKDPNDSTYRSFEIIDNRYLFLSQEKASDYAAWDGTITEAIAGKWYFDVELIAEGALSEESQTIYQGVIVFQNDVTNSSGVEVITPALPTNEVVYEELVLLIEGNALVIGDTYTITDFATKHYLLDGDVQTLTAPHTATVEPIVVTAISENALSPIAHSTLFPQDILTYDWNPSNFLKDISFSSGGVIIDGFKGVITKRIDTLQKNETPFDFRGVRNRRWLSNLPVNDDFGSNYLEFTSTSGPDSNDYVDYATFHKYENVRGNVIKENEFPDYDAVSPNTTIIPNVVFYNNSVIAGDYNSDIKNNVFDSGFRKSNFASEVKNNMVGKNFYNNVIGTGFSKNIIGPDFYNNVVEGYFELNRIDGNAHNLNIPSGTELNPVQNNIFSFNINRTLSTLDLTGLLTQLKGEYTCKLTRGAGSDKFFLIYTNEVGQPITITNI